MSATIDIPRLPWEKQEKETIKAFGYFAYYRDLGSERTKARVARDMKLSPSRVNELATKHKWDDRVEQYDLDRDRRYLAQRETAVDAMNRRQGQLGQAAQRLAGQRLTSLQPETLDAGDAARLLEVGVRIERLAAGLPTEVMRGAVSITASEFQRYVTDVVGAILPFVPEEQRPAAITAAEAVFER